MGRGNRGGRRPRNKILTIVLNKIANTCVNLKNSIKYDILEGFPAGCLNICFGSVWYQYSSSHSTGKSTSKLLGGLVSIPEYTLGEENDEKEREREGTTEGGRREEKRNHHSLLILNSTRSPQRTTNHPIHTNQHPKRSLPHLILSRHLHPIILPPMSSYVLG